MNFNGAIYFKYVCLVSSLNIDLLNINRLVYYVIRTDNYCNG